MDTPPPIAVAAAPHHHQVLVALLPPLAFMTVCLLGLNNGYLLFHTLAELFPVLIAFTALVVATTSFTFTRNHFLVYIAVSTGWSATLDIAHLLVYQGMGLVAGDGSDLTIRFWVAARLIQGVALATAPLLLHHRMPLLTMHLIYSSAVLAAGLAIVYGPFPPLLVEGKGLTPLKIGIEYTVIALLALAVLQLWRQRRLLSQQICLGMMTALALMMASEFAFTLYADLVAPSNLIGHLLKIFAYWFIYLALVANTLREPFAALARAARTYDAVPDPTLIVSARGLIRLANAAAGRSLGADPEALVGRPRHLLFHDPAVPEAECPVCGRLAGGREEAFRIDLSLEQGARTVECSIAPFEDDLSHHSHVEVIHDISERRRLYGERERLIGDLNERIKELRALREISALSGKRDLRLEEYLNGVASLLPGAFRTDSLARAVIVSAWGVFGDTWPAPAPARLLERPVHVDGDPRGMVKIWYPEPVQGLAGTFLPEESALLEQVARTVGETIERLRDAGRVKQLSRLYEMLSATNRALVYSRSTDELFANLLDGLTASKAFTIIFLARYSGQGLPLQLVNAHGIPRERQQDLADWLADPRGSFIQALPAFIGGNVMSGPVPAADSAPWQAWLQRENLTEYALVPLMREEKLLGVIGLYASSGLTTFDEDHLRLLDEMTVDIAFGLKTQLIDSRRRQAEAEAAAADRRFRDIFEASPLPMIIVAMDTRKVIDLNYAHRQWLGYELSDIPDEKTCFERFFPREEQREAMSRLWNESLAQSGSGRIVASDVDVHLRGKDGAERIAHGTLTLSDNIIILAWTDISRIRESEKRLSESERRFRGMIEQTNSGIYVRREARFLYVNPRYCEMIGWDAEELVGREVLEITPHDPENLAAIRAAWEKLHLGGGVVAYEVPIRRKDGTIIQLGLSAKVILWDDDLPATIVMAQDITERKRTEARLAEYVNRLEHSLKATLQAVSAMVELRDPYTAGHERRVGLIAGDIGRALGWTPERCEMLEMTGLVHDIGKIAVPSEILTKPSRLSTLEMEIIKGHAQAGYEILKDVPFEAPVAEIIRQHHERLDGSGYPRGLKGNEILPEARVLAVADVVESMAAHRPYRAALGLDKALAEIERGRGSHYDPEVVDAFVSLVREKSYTLPQ